MSSRHPAGHLEGAGLAYSDRPLALQGACERAGDAAKAARPAARPAGAPLCTCANLMRHAHPSLRRRRLRVRRLRPTGFLVLYLSDHVSNSSRRSSK